MESSITVSVENQEGEVSESFGIEHVMYNDLAAKLRTTFGL